MAGIAGDAGVGHGGRSENGAGERPIWVRPPVPDARGRFGQFGGKYAPETLMPALDELESAYAEARRDPKFQDVVDRLARNYVGRPTPSTSRGT